MSKKIIGNEEWCALEPLGIPAIKARVDSGAQTSVLHAFNVQPFKKNNENWVSFEVHPIQNSRKENVRCEALVIARRSIKSSNGLKEKRYVIKTEIKIGDNLWDIEVSLTNRDAMGYRMLLGREAMASRFLVDPEEIQLLSSISDDQAKDFYKVSSYDSNGLKIGVLASDSSLYSNKRIMEAGEERGHEMIFLNIKHCYIKLDADSPEIHYRGGKILNHLDAVIPRIRPSVTFYGTALVRQFEHQKIFSLNSASSISVSRDKLHSLQILRKFGLHIPSTGFANSPLDTNELIEMLGGAPLVIKLLEGAQGKGVVLAETKKAAESVINAFKSLHANLLVQEFIKEANGKDLRLFVIDGKVVASIQRAAQPGEFKSNIHQGGAASLVKITNDEKKIAVQAAKAMGLKVAGVDIIRSNNGPLLLEVNSSPGLEGIEEATGKDIAGMMISAIEKNLNWVKE